MLAIKRDDSSGFAATILENDEEWKSRSAGVIEAGLEVRFSSREKILDATPSPVVSQRWQKLPVRNVHTLWPSSLG